MSRAFQASAFALVGPMTTTLVLFFAQCATAQLSTVDYAEVANREAWLRHPVYGDASFDSFVHHQSNPIHRGAAPYEWPVNGSLFEDTIGGDWWLFIGHYRTGYKRDVDHPTHATVMQSSDHGATWKNHGRVFPDEPHTFSGEFSPTWYGPDVAVIHADGRYHMSYDWATKSSTWGNAANPDADSNSGAGYAWADQPQGPYHRITRPIATTRDQSPLLGKYKRIYASTILRREKDWLVLTLTDSGPNYGWAFLAMTADAPEGPYSKPKLVLYPETPKYHPPLMEFHPAFAHEGYVYAPATSVARNRNFQALWRAPLEQALDPAAWEIVQHGSVWHAEPVEHEHYGIWGQTLSGFIDEAGMFRVMFPSRDSQGMGTINIAERPWSKPYRERGFFLSGHQAPSFVRLKYGGSVREIAINLDVRGTITLVWNATGPVGPNRPTSDAELHPLMLTRFTGLELNEGNWTLLNVDAKGEHKPIANGKRAKSGRANCALTWSDDEFASLRIDEQEVWSGALPSNSGTLGLLVAEQSSAYVERFAVTAKITPIHSEFLYTEALLGAAQNMNNWEAREDKRFRHGIGAVSRDAAVEAKWNFIGKAATLWAPRGPSYGQAKVFLDGIPMGVIDFKTKSSQDSQPVFTLEDLENTFHAFTLRSMTDSIPLDTLEVTH